MEPVRRLAGKTIDVPAIAIGILRPAPSAIRPPARSNDTPSKRRRCRTCPTTAFIFNATNLQSAVLWRFSKPYMRDYRVGEVQDPPVPLATAVAASAAFPPFLSPVQLELEEQDYTRGADPICSALPSQPDQPSRTEALRQPGPRNSLEAYQTILISDGGGRIGGKADVKRDWPRHAHRVLNVIDSQVRALRKRQAIEGFRAGRREEHIGGSAQTSPTTGSPTHFPVHSSTHEDWPE